MITKLTGELEIDHVRGVIYFTNAKTGWSVLRICNLPEIPKGIDFIDISHMRGVNYNKSCNVATTTKLRQ